MEPLPQVLQVALVALVLTAAVYDLLYRRIPNWLVVTGLAAGLALNTTCSGWPGLLSSCKGFAFGFVIYVIFYALRAMGAGDVKLMGAVGSIAGPVNWISIFLVTSITGGVLAILLLLWRGGLQRALTNIIVIFGEISQGRAPHRAEPALDVASPTAVTLPHGITIAIGTGLFLFLLYLQPRR